MPSSTPPWPVTRRDGRGKWAEAWMIVRDTSSDNSMVNLMWSAMVGPDGSMYHERKRVDSEHIGWHVAAVAGFDKGKAEALFREALLGRPVSA